MAWSYVTWRTNFDNQDKMYVNKQNKVLSNATRDLLFSELQSKNIQKVSGQFQVLA